MARFRYDSMAMDYVFPVLIVVAALGLAAWWIRHALLTALRRDTNAQALLLLQNQMQAGLAQTTQQAEGLQKHLREELRLLHEQVARALTDANRTLGDRLDNTAKVIGDIRGQLGQMDEASKRIFDVGRNIAELQQTLQAPKLRGGFGEYLLTELLAQVLPEQSYALQYKFKGGETVDAVIKLSLGLAAIDAKFPLENFTRSVNSADEPERAAAGKQFVRDVKKHIDDIAKKYIRTDEGTLDFAMMYIPAENVYYAIIVRNEGNDDAQRGEFYLAAWEISPAGWREISPLKIVAGTVVESLKSTGEICVGPDQEKTIFPPAAQVALLASGRTDFMAGEKLEPIYLRATNFVKAPLPPPRSPE